MSAAVVRTRRREMIRVLAAEWSKLWSLPAVWLTLGGTWLINCLLTAALANAELQDPASTRSAFEIGLTSISYIQAGYIILGILAACSEYTGGQIRTTLIAMPRRGLQLVAAHLALIIMVVPAAILTAASGVLIAAVVYGDALVPFEWGNAAGTLAGAGGYLGLTTLISAAVGVLLRRTLSAAAVVLGYYFIVGPLLREQIAQAKYFPDTAGLAMWLPQAGHADALSPAYGAMLLLAWALVVFAFAAAVYRSRDT